MNKKDFLKIIEKKLIVLNVEERKDIVAEYTDIIDKKIGAGKTEEEAVNEFGDIDVLTEEILKAYKINTDYQNGEEKNDNFFDNINNTIKKASKVISNFAIETTKKIKNDNENITVELVIESIIKIMIALFILSLLFNVLQSYGSYISRLFSFGILDYFLTFIWQLVTGIIFLLLAILVSYSIINDDFNKNKNAHKKSLLKKEPKNKKTLPNKRPKVAKNETIKPDVIREKKDKSYTGDAFTILLKVFSIVWILPVIFTLISAYFILTMLIYAFVKGILVYGFIVITIGIIIFAHHFINVTYAFAFKSRKLKMYPFLISVVIMFVGIFLSIDYIANLNVYEKFNEDKYTKSEYIINEKVTDELDIFLHYGSKAEIMIDETLKNDEVIIKVLYNEKFISNINYYYFNEDLSIYKRENNRNIYNEYIENLKNNEVYRISDYTEYEIIIFSNSEFSDKIEILNH